MCEHNLSSFFQTSALPCHFNGPCRGLRNCASFNEGILRISFWKDYNLYYNLVSGKVPNGVIFECAVSSLAVHNGTSWLKVCQFFFFSLRGYRLRDYRAFQVLLCPAFCIKKYPQVPFIQMCLYTKQPGCRIDFSLMPFKREI